MPNIHEPLLVNAIGHSAGALIFGIFLFLFLKDRSGSRYLRGSWLSITAASLAFLWDVGSLAALISVEQRSWYELLLIAFSFAMLSLLPAVLLHLSLDRDLTVVVSLGYFLGMAAAALHISEGFYPDHQARRIALLLIPVGFGCLTATAVAMLALRKGAPPARGPSHIFGAMCLFLFAVSFAHFGSASPDHRWSSELIIHHAGIPLALFVLLQDYRFVMLDAFVRFLPNVLLAALLTFVVIRTGLKFLLVETHSIPNPLYEALWLTALCIIMLIAFALARGRLQLWLTRAVFRRPSLDRALQQIRARPTLHESESAYLSWAAKEMAAVMNTPQFDLVPETALPRSFDLLYPVVAADRPDLRSYPAFAWGEAVIPIRSHKAMRASPCWAVAAEAVAI